MAAKGSNAKLDVIAKLQEVFGENFIGEVDKRVYVYANDGGEMVQIAIAMTCPKTPVEASPAVAASGTVLQCKIDPDGKTTDYTGVKGPIPQSGAFEISDEESEKVADLLAELNISTK